MLKSIKVDHSGIYFIVLCLAIISLPLSRFGLSVAQFALIGNWLFERDFKRKLNDLKRNTPAIVLISLFVLHIIGLLFTSDFQYAFKDIRIKLPILVFPVIIATTPQLNVRKVNLLLLLYVGASLSACFVSFGIYLANDFSDIREISPFISHIRLSLNICLAILISGYLLIHKLNFNLYIKILLAISIGCMVLFLILIESITGIVVLVVVFLALLISWIIKARNYYRKAAYILLLIIVPLFLVLYFQQLYYSYNTPILSSHQTLDTITEQGNDYNHDTILLPVENGSYIGLFICEKELRESWNARSKLDFDGKDAKNQELKSTIIRYLNSKHLRKDNAGIKQLSEKDISHIEKGIANYYYTRKLSLNSRIYKILWELEIYRRGYNPGGNSLIQRLEFWKISVDIIKDNFWYGVGTGDIDLAFKNQYEKSKSELQPQWRHRSHNQYLAIFVTFGVAGLLWFLFTLFYPGLKLRLFSDYLYFVFIIVMMLSMFAEDTLETQMGVSLFAFFNSFLLFGRNSNSDNYIQ